MKRILTTPEEIQDDTCWLVTGNEYVSLPLIRPGDGYLEGFGVIYFSRAALIETSGPGGRWLGPWLRLGGRDQVLRPAGARYEEDWVPVLNFECGEAKVSQRVFCPPGLKGFLVQLEIQNGGERIEVSFGLEGAFSHIRHTVYTSRDLEAGFSAREDRWLGGPVFECGLPDPVLAWAVGLDEDGSFEISGRKYRFSYRAVLDPGKGLTRTFYVGVGREADGARTTAIHLKRAGAGALLGETLEYLRSRRVSLEDPRLESTANLNLFFNLFYSSALTIDGEERVLMTSRSPQYYVSAAFWARDALLWSFPGLLVTDRKAALEVLRAAFDLYWRNAGVHSLYIDGSVLYPGFELDEHCAPVLAAEGYSVHTGDEDEVRCLLTSVRVDEWLEVLAGRRHPDHTLYSTELYPSDDPAEYPYLTYDNALVARALRYLARLTGRRDLEEESRAVLRTVREMATVEGSAGPVFAWAFDGEGNHLVYDEPPGSLQLLPRFGFCAPDDPVYLNTVRWIRSEENPYYYKGRFCGAGCPHAPHPSVMDLFNRLLSGDKGPLSELRELALDGGLACETYYEATGRVATGRHFATCAGMLGYAIVKAVGRE